MTTKRSSRGLGDDATYRRRRPRPAREPRARWLIVCEGAKTEPTYFDDLRRACALTSTEVRICGEECGTHPRSVVNYAAELQKTARRDNAPYDAVWCVFDRDDHIRIHEALDRARSCGIQVAFSNPCFELWFLLHYRYSTSQKGREQLAAELRTYIPDYTKSKPGMYRLLREQEPKAHEHAAKLRAHHAKVDDGRPENPSTSVDLLVRALNSLAER